MARLFHREYDRLLACVTDLHTQHDLNGFARHVLTVGRKAVAADSGVWDEINLRRRRHTWLADPVEVDLSSPDEAHARLFTDHPFVKQLKRTGDVPAARLSDYLSRREYHETGLYREAYRGFGVEYQLGFSLPSPSPQFFIGLAFNRRRRDFSEADRLMFEMLRPHFLQAYRNAEIMTHLRAKDVQMASALEAVRQGVITLDATGRVVLCSKPARDWLAWHFGAAALCNHRLPEILWRWVQEQQMPATRTGKFPALRQPFLVETEGHRLTIRLAAGIAPGQQLLLLEDRRTALFAAPLQQLGLTVRQADVLLWVTQGKTNIEVGIILGLSAGTVHKHLEHIFEKLGVETRTAAAVMAMEVLSGPPPIS